MSKRNFIFVLTIIVCLLLVISTNSSVIADVSITNAYVIDQQQWNYSTSTGILFSLIIYQSFTPSVNSISIISVSVFNTNTENPTGRYLNLSLTDNNNGLAPLTSGIIDVSELELDTFSWFNITFSPISITSGETYYIFLRDPTFTTTDDLFRWGKWTIYNDYLGGFSSTNPSHDHTFVTYYDDIIMPEFNNKILVLVSFIPLILFMILGKKNRSLNLV